MRIYYASGNILVSPAALQGAATQIEGFTSALTEAGHTVTVDLCGDRVLYPHMKNRPWLKWIKENVGISWLAYEGMQMLNNWRVARRLRRLNRGDFDLLWQRYELFTTAYSRWAERAGIPSALFFDAPLLVEREQYGRLWLKRRAIAVLRHNVARSDLLVAISRPVAEHVRSTVGDPDLPIHIMPNGFPTQIAEADSEEVERIRKRYFGPFSGPIIGFVGSIKPWHRVDYLIEAAAVLARQRTDFRVLIVGDGPDLPKQRELIARLGLSDIVKTTGMIPFRHIAPYLHGMDIGVMPDSNLYGSPMKISEYMAGGAAVVAPDIQPIRELCEHGKTGMLFPKGSVPALTECLRALLARPEGLARLKANARHHALTTCSWQARVAQLHDVLGPIVAKMQNGGRDQ